ncbi:hypothetical protein HPP92_016501 [Vanilla planifolia]|uniref:MYB transcription factor n=1 Tax=Vanilla planifolia TaxID=51239 RepID=A0A835QFC3_VANPL|nr:hypothetical protein HPP92_016501 [Vanilla planifolia]
MARCSVGAEVKSLFGFKNPSYASFELVHKRGCDGTDSSSPTPRPFPRDFDISNEMLDTAPNFAIASRVFIISMGAPKQKWTAEEESALKAGVAKHGSGNWRTILRDPEFSGILFLRSNVDLKDKWRNMRVTANGCGSREKARAVFKRSKNVSKHDDNLLAISKHDDNPLAIGMVAENVDDELVGCKPLEMSSTAPHITGSKRSLSKMEGLIMEAITWLKEPKGSNKTAIATYIEEQYVVPTDFKFLLSAKLKALIGCGKLIKVKRKYRIAPPSPAIAEGRKSKASYSEAKRSEDEKCMAKLQIDAELERMRNMSAQEAAAAAAQAIAEAEKAIAEAEEATQEAEAAEADAEAAQAFAEAAMLTLKSRNTAKVVALPDRL